MKKLVHVLSISILCAFTAGMRAQDHTWIKGSDQTYTPGVNGTSLTPHPANNPGARYGMVSWQTSSTTVWVFGGQAIDFYVGNGWIQDLWQYDIPTNTWTWMKGSKSISQIGVYGTKGVASANNSPGARWEAVAWTDNTNLYLFGGNGFGSTGSMGELNDLWKYEISTNNWTWLAGSNLVNQPGAYGTLGAGSSTTVPGGRSSSSAWRDASGNLWIFGGMGKGSQPIPVGRLNDLWKYDMGTNQWTWMGGSNVTDATGTYGSVLVPSASNIPGARKSPGTWVDASGNFLLFGGYGFGASGSPDYLNDTWKYDVSNGQWTWLGGSNSGNQFGNYGPAGVFGAAYVPGSRGDCTTWQDKAGNCWMGYGYGNGTSTKGYLNDLWKYDAGTNTWAWVTGSSTPSVVGVYGQQGAPSPTHVIGGRTTAAGWLDGNENLYTFGGFGYGSAASTPSIGYLNDVWKYTNCDASAISVSITAATYTICAGEKIILTASGASTFTWNNGVQSSSIQVSPGATQAYTASTTNANGCVFTRSVNIAVNPCVGLDQITTAKKINVYPNPSNGKIRVSIPPGQKTDLSILNSLGQVVWEKENLENEVLLNLQLTKGLYFYVIGASEKEKQTGRLVIE